MSPSPVCVLVRSDRPVSARAASSSRYALSFWRVRSRWLAIRVDESVREAPSL
jgi:hypothetical protein